MKRLIGIIVFSGLLMMTLLGCKSQNNDITANESEVTSQDDTEASVAVDEELVIEPIYREFPEIVRNVFGDNWTTPGLVNADGSVYIPPEANVTTGVRINVVDYGAVAGDESFDNSESFQLAMDAAVAGDEVYVPEGTYYFSEAALFSNSYVAHIVLKEGVNFVGDGMDKSILVSCFDADTNEKYKTTVVLIKEQSNIVVSGIQITSLTEDSMLPDPNVSNLNHFVGTAPVYGIVIDNDKPLEIHGNVVVDGVLVETFQRMGVRISRVRDVRILNSVFQKATDLGGGGAGYAISIQGMTNDVDVTDTNIDVLYNVVENCTINGPYMRHGIIIQYYAHNNLITGNTIQDTLLDAIDLHGEDEYSNEIVNNTIINTRRGAAVGVGNSGATHDASGPYNYIHDNEIIGGDRGIDVLYGSPNTVIYNNRISDIDNGDGTGIFLQNANHTVIANNIIRNMKGEEAVGLKILYSYVALAPEEGLPDGIRVLNNTFESLSGGYYVESHTSNYESLENVFTDCLFYDELDDNSNFEVPAVSDVVIPRNGDLLLPSDDNFITNENRTAVQSQSNMKFKSSYFDVPYNRMIYMKFDLGESTSNKEHVYLKFSGKSKDGLCTINIYASTTYTDWSESTITWENALYHEDQVAKRLDPDDELTHVTDFTFTSVGSEFNTYYVDVTDYINSIETGYVTFILVNDAVENMYCEIYSKETSSDDYKPGLLWSNE